MDKIALVIILIVVVSAVGFFIWQYRPEVQGPTSSKVLPEGIVYFYGDTCPHCKDVEDFVDQNNIKEKVQFTSLEVFQNQENALLAYQVEKNCGLDVSQGVEVPMVYDGQKCYLGATDAVNFFKNAAEIQ